MKQTHTPAPWKVAGDPLVPNRLLIEKRSNGWKTFIAEVYGDEDHQGGKDFAGNREANARLIASAPDLLEALQRIMEQIADMGIVNALEGQLALSAIAKAKGTP